jgi:YesN/AraC family two-component response regulator
LLNIREKNKSEIKFKNIIEEYQHNLEIKNVTQLLSSENINEEIVKTNQNSVLTLDEEKEKQIFNKLKLLEDKLIFLNQDFTLQFVAKKIKTNTTYLSYVVNKNFGKNFSEYANELKINYAINEMISNQTYRKYSTLAIAESVGFKNATSFTRTFSKRTGLSPVQFAQKLNDLI